MKLDDGNEVESYLAPLPKRPPETLSDGEFEELKEEEPIYCKGCHRMLPVEEFTRRALKDYVDGIEDAYCKRCDP